MRSLFTCFFILLISLLAYGQNKVILVAGTGVDTPVIVKLNNGQTYKVYSSTEVSGKYSVSSATDSNGNKLQWKFSHSGGTTGGKSYSIDTYTFYTSSSNSSTYGSSSSSNAYNHNTPSSKRINRSGRDRRESYDPISPELDEINDIWDIKYNNKPIVIEAYSFKNPECREYSLIFDKLASEYENQIDFYKINIDKRNAGDFYERYKVTTTPSTIFIWDPAGDASVKENVEKGPLSLSELQACLEETLNRHYTRAKAQDIYDASEDNSVSQDYAGDSNEPEYITVYLDDSPELLPYLGTWKGVEDGYESVLKFWIEEGCVACTGRTDSPQRLSVYNTPYWWFDNSEWDPKEKVIKIQEVISSTPLEFYSVPSITETVKKGIFKTKTLKIKDNKIFVDVKEYIDKNNWDKKIVSKQYTLEYDKVSE